MMPICIGAWMGHTDQSRAMAQSLTAALTRHGVKHETAAAAMGLGFEDFGKQLSGQKPLNAWRIGYLPAAVYLEWLRLEAKRHGAEMVTAEDRAFVIGFATAGMRRMAKMLPHFCEERKQA